MAMPENGSTGPQVDDTEAVRAEWLDRLNALASRIKGWAEKSGWRTRLVSKPTRDSILGRYEVPLLLMERDAVEIALNPVSRFVPGADGAVDLYVVPAYDAVTSLYLVDGEWTLHHVTPPTGEAGIPQDEAMPVSEATIVWILDEMAGRVAE